MTTRAIDGRPRPAGASPEDLAEELTLHLGAPFVATPEGRITFRQKLRVTDWAVPLLFDGHAGYTGDGHGGAHSGGLMPTSAVGRLLWPSLRASRPQAGHRLWWTCSLRPETAAEILDHLRPGRGPVADGEWRAGRDFDLKPRRRPRLAA